MKPDETLTDAVKERLLEQAGEARARAYAPYSGFCVGAALLAASGAVYTGCNIENAAFSPTVCAERCAFFKAVEAGERVFRAIAVVGGKSARSPGFCPPCGVCRQVMREFCGPEKFAVILSGQDGPETHALSELLPMSFGPDDVR